MSPSKDLPDDPSGEETPAPFWAKLALTAVPFALLAALLLLGRCVP